MCNIPSQEVYILLISSISNSNQVSFGDVYQKKKSLLEIDCLYSLT